MGYEKLIIPFSVSGGNGGIFSSWLQSEIMV